MRVLMSADTVGGVWTYAIELAEALGARGVEVTIAAMGAPASPAQRRRAQAIRTAKLCEVPYKLEWMNDPWDDVERSKMWLRALERASRPDIVHLNTYAHGDVGFAAPVLVVCHSCVRSWWWAVHGAAPPADWETYTREVGRGLAAADLVVAPTRTMLDEAIHHYGITGPTRVIPNGLDPTRYPIAEPEPFVISSGRLWDEAKNLVALDAASRGLEWPVYVAGPTQHPDGSSIEPGSARALGPLTREEVLDWMARAAIYALPARYEPFGLSALEAALSGCALVLGDIPSLREIWDGAARFVPPEDPAELHEVLRALIRDPDARRDLATRARQRALSLDAGPMAAAYARAYRELAAGARRDESPPPAHP